MLTRVKKVKDWAKDHKEELKSEAIKIGYYAGGAIIGYHFGKRIALLEDSIILSKLERIGIIKLVDPTTGLEIDVSDVKHVVERLTE